MERLRPYFSFRGRSARLAYWRLQLVSSAIVGGLVILSMLLIPAIGRLAGVVMLFVLPILAVSIAMAVRRLHDRDRSGWWLLPYTLGPGLLYAWAEAQGQGDVGPVVILLSLTSFGLSVWAFADLGFLRGTPGSNRFGADPESPLPQEVFG